MARRRKDIMRRKKLQEEQTAVNTVSQEPEPAGEPDEDLSERELSTREAPAPPPRASHQEKPDAAPRSGKAGWLGRNKENLLLGLLVMYVVLLGLGTVGELFEIEWILNLPIFR